MIRRLSTVIDVMLDHIPDTEVSLIAQLKSVQTSFMYCPPEQEVLWWNECADVLTNNIPVLEWDWQTTIAQIFNGEE